MRDLVIRPFLEEDLQEIKGVLREAFDRPGKNQEFNEWELADRVRPDPGYVGELCLVATLDGELVGYVLLSKATIGSHEGLSLGPLAVKPSHQRSGIGGRLIQECLARAEQLGFSWVALTGGNYYSRFGFEGAQELGIILAPDHSENSYLKIKFLGDQREVMGEMRFCASFYNKNGELL